MAVEDFHLDPVLVYLLATRLTDPELEVRFQVIKLLGSLLDFKNEEQVLQGRALECLVGYLAAFEKSQYVKMLEVSEAYLAAEEPLAAILRICSYAGKPLGGIVNDRKLPVRVRQQAIFFCGEIGFLSAASALRNLISRVDKDRHKQGNHADRQDRKDLEALYNHAVSALGKLEV